MMMLLLWLLLMMMMMMWMLMLTLMALRDDVTLPLGPQQHHIYSTRQTSQPFSAQDFRFHLPSATVSYFKLCQLQ